MNSELLITNVECNITGSIENKNKAMLLNDTTPENKSGIYKIINKINNKYYIGSAFNLDKRFKRHIRNLRSNKHTNPHLQSAWNKYGESNFKFIIVKYTDINKLISEEQIALDICKQLPSSNYNISYGATSPMLGRKHSPETRAKIKENWKHISHPMIGKKHSDETKKRWSMLRKGQFVGIKNPMYGKQGANFGKTFSKETREKMSKNSAKYWSGRQMTDEHRKKLSISHIGMGGWKWTDESKEKLKISKRKLTVFKIKNSINGEIFDGTIYTIKEKLNVHKDTISRFINRHNKFCCGWMLI